MIKPLNAVLDSAKTVINRMDGWNNVLTGLGIKGRDKRMSSDFAYERMAKTDSEHLYASDDMAEKIVDIPAEEMQREGFEVTHSNDDETLNNLLNDKYEELGMIDHVDNALKWASLYGGSAILLGIQDGRKPHEPVNFAAIKGIEFANVMHRWELNPVESKIQKDPTKKNFGRPGVYTLSAEQGEGATNIEIHSDRMLIFQGAKLPKNLFVGNNYWNDSVLNRSQNAIRNFQTAHDSAATLVHDFAQAVYKIKHLTEMISQGRDDLVQKRLELIDACRSIVNAIVIEDGEDFERKTTSLQGLPELLGKIEQRLVQTSKIPHTVLLGEGPKGSLGQSGDSERKDWYQHVSRLQQVKLKPQLVQFFTLCLLSKDGPTKGIEPKTWDIEFNPLWQMSQKDKSEVYLKNAQGDLIYLNTGVVDPDEVATSRFGTNEGEIQIDTELRGRQNPAETEENENE